MSLRNLINAVVLCVSLSCGAHAQDIAARVAESQSTFEPVPLAFAGVWKNKDDLTRGITKLDIKVEGTAVSVEAWGACHPHDCDWGRTTAIPYKRDVSSQAGIVAIAAPFKTTFAERLLIINFVGIDHRAALEVQDLTQFTDNTGRSNYAATNFFQTRNTSNSIAGRMIFGYKVTDEDLCRRILDQFRENRRS